MYKEPKISIVWVILWSTVKQKVTPLRFHFEVYWGPLTVNLTGFINFCRAFGKLPHFTSTLYEFMQKSIYKALTMPL